VVPTPIVNGNHVLVSSGYAVGSHLFEVSGSGGKFTTKRVYASKKLKNDFGGVIKIGDQVYGSSGVVLVCMDFNTGEDVWKKRTIGGGGLLYADGHFYLRNDRGLVALLKATPEDLVEKSQFEEGDRSDHKSWPTPVISNGHLYLRDQDTMTSYDIRKK
jgi:outer membrane protein assembly factor BamB